MEGFEDDIIYLVDDIDGNEVNFVYGSNNNINNNGRDIEELF